MKKTLPASDGKRINLLGCRVEQVRFCAGGPPVRFVLMDEHRGLVQLSIDGEIKLQLPQGEMRLTGAKPGVTFDPCELSPLLGLLGTQVMDTETTPSGGLEITFSNQWSLFAGVDDYNYPVWHVRTQELSLT